MICLYAAIGMLTITLAGMYFALCKNPLAKGKTPK